MAKSLTARLGLQRWTEDADTQDRTEFDGAHAQLEDLAAGFLRDLIANRPAAAAANAGFLFEDTDTGELYWSTGVAWLGPFATVGDLAHAHGLDDLSDVDTSTTAPVSGDLLTFNGSEWAPDSGSSAASQVSAVDGSDAAPSISFASDPDTGFWRAPADSGRVRLALDGANAYQFESVVFRPTPDATKDLGAGTQRFRDAFLSGDVKDASGNAKYSRVEAKSTPGTAPLESVTWTVAFAATPVVTASALSGGAVFAVVESRSTTGASVRSRTDAGTSTSVVKDVIATKAT